MRLLAYVTGSVNQELFLRNEYLAMENRILRSKLPSRFRLTNPERVTLAGIGSDLAGKHYAKSQPWRNQTPSWLGIGGWLRRSLTVLRIGSIPAAHLTVASVTSSRRRWAASLPAS